MVAASVGRSEFQPAGEVPAPTTALLGRGRELRQLIDLLADDDTRTVTLLGPGGVGKTRIAIAVAAELQESQPGSVCFVSLAHTGTRAAMVAELAGALGVREEAGVDAAAALAAALRDNVHLLVLDNLEQIPDAGIEVAAVLRACPGLTVLATSRTPIHIAGERRFLIEPLAVDAGAELPAAVRLFVERSVAVAPGFVLTESNTPVVTDICRRLDGLPLAIELAAARSRSLSPEALLARLTNRLTVLGGGPIDAPHRQRTLQTAIAWSYDLLNADAQRAFRRLATIPGGISHDLAAAVLGLGETDALSAIDALIDQSLLSTLPGDGGDIRFGMLQTIRDFGLERAETDGDLLDARAALAKHVYGLAGTIRAGLEGVDEPDWRAWCARERPVVAAAIDWFVDHAERASAVAIANAYWRFWYHGGHYREGIATLERILSGAHGVAAIDLARAYNGLGALYFGLDVHDAAAAAFDRATFLWDAAGDLTGLANTTNNRALLAQSLGDLSGAIAGFERAIEIVTALGDTRRLASALDNLGMTLEAAGQHERAAELHARALATSREIGDEQCMASALRHLASALALLGDVDGAIERADESREIWERLGVRDQLAYSLNTLGTLLERTGDSGGAEQRYEQAFAIWETLEEPRGIALALHNLAACAIARGEPARALKQLRRSLSIRRVAGNPIDLAYSFAGFSDVALASGDPVRATRLYAFSRSLFESSRIEPPGSDERSQLRRALGRARFDAAWKTGSAMSLDDAMVETERISVTAGGTPFPSPADPGTSPAPAPVSSATSQDHGLTARELDVLRQVAAGKTNAEIGEALFISPFTAKTHVANLLGKLGVESRAAASTWAAQHNLL